MLNAVKCWLEFQSQQSREDASGATLSVAIINIFPGWLTKFLHFSNRSNNGNQTDFKTILTD